MNQLISAILIILLTTASGFFDAFGAIHAAKIWGEGGRLVWNELGMAAGGFIGGISVYLIAIRFMKEVGIVSAEIQTTIWFGVMLLGVALASGAFFRWRTVDQVVAVGVAVGILFLSIRTGQ